MFKDVHNGRTKLVDAAPPGLADTPLYVAAKSLADEAKELVRTAQKARDAGDEATFQEQGALAKEKLETAYGKIADWLVGIEDQYPDDQNVILVPDNNMRYEILVKAMDVARDDPNTKVDEKARELFPFVIIAGGAL